MAWLPLVALSGFAYLPAAIPRPTTLQRNLALDISSAVGLGTIMAVVGELLPSMARREGLDSMGLAALAALPFLATLLTLFAGRIGPRTTGRMGVLRAAGVLGLLLVLIAPHPAFIAAATFGFWISFALTTPLQQRIWASIYPSADRGRLLGYVGTGRFAAGTLALLAITVAATTSGWVPIIAVVAVVGAASSLAVSRMSVPSFDGSGHFSALGSLRSVAGTPVVRRIAVAQLLFGAGALAAPALIAMVYIDRLALGMQDIALAGLVSYGTTAATIGPWSWLAGRLSALRTIAMGTVLGVLAMALFAAAGDYPSILVATLLLGTSNAAVNASWPLLIADHAAEGEQAAVAAGMNSIMGLRGLVTPFLVMAPVGAGIIDETGGLVLCFATSLAGALLYARLAGLASLLQRRPASSAMPLSSISGWPVSCRNRLMRSTMAGWVLKRPRALLSSFLTGLTT